MPKIFSLIIRRSFSSATKSSTVDSEEILRFNKFVSEWWNDVGPMKPLHSLNLLRVPFIREGLKNTEVVGNKIKSNPLENVNILDIGCGGGILSEPLSRIGGKVTGLDANPEIIELAKCHAKNEHLCINYLAGSIEDHAKDNNEMYDCIVASEIIEHVTYKKQFLHACIKCLKPEGSIFITTINQTLLANIGGILLSENVFNLLPKGTHQYEKFIEPHKIERMLEEENCKTVLIHGMFYNIFTNSWKWCLDTSVNYALHAVKLPQINEN